MPEPEDLIGADARHRPAIAPSAQKKRSCFPGPDPSKQHPNESCSKITNVPRKHPFASETSTCQGALVEQSNGRRLCKSILWVSIEEWGSVSERDAQEPVG